MRPESAHNGGIDGSTQIYGVIGQPVAHSLSPLIHNAAFHKLGMNAAYVAFPVAEGCLGLAFEAVRALEIRGVNVTIPFKEEAEDFVDEIPEDVDRAVGAINTVVNRDGILYGYNTDVQGFLTSLAEELKFHPSGKTALVLGAGGAARAGAFALAGAGAARILILNRSAERGEGLSDYLGQHFPELDADAVSSAEHLHREKIDVVVNATSVGMKPGDPAPLDLEIFSKAPAVYDMVYTQETALVKKAKQLKVPAANGLGMLAAQAAASFELWTGKKEGVREAMLEALKAWRS